MAALAEISTGVTPPDASAAGKNFKKLRPGRPSACSTWLGLFTASNDCVDFWRNAFFTVLPWGSGLELRWIRYPTLSQGRSALALLLYRHRYTGYASRIVRMRLLPLRYGMWLQPLVAVSTNTLPVESRSTLLIWITGITSNCLQFWLDHFWDIIIPLLFFNQLGSYAVHGMILFVYWINNDGAFSWCCRRVALSPVRRSQ